MDFPDDIEEYRELAVSLRRKSQRKLLKVTVNSITIVAQPFNVRLATIPTINPSSTVSAMSYTATFEKKPEQMGLEATLETCRTLKTPIEVHVKPESTIGQSSSSSFKATKPMPKLKNSVAFKVTKRT
ncbi:hypothetical protein L596_026264 [Steinernema carpocapsae]|uniref:Uncharacterized protein n=1 Tax=Steinernema carpocapsae TaxID=34508 RepID=A0A4U5M0U3_STECR|nr:hypothetical protein L596_026264 [Steinernema carpocapsae]